jgi:hypothetical protein
MHDIRHTVGLFSINSVFRKNRFVEAKLCVMTLVNVSEKLTGATCGGAESVYPSGAPEFTPGF